MKIISEIDNNSDIVKVTFIESNTVEMTKSEYLKHVQGFESEDRSSENSKQTHQE